MKTLTYNPFSIVRDLENYISEQRHIMLEDIASGSSFNSFSNASYEDLERMDEGEVHDKYFDFFEDFDENVLKKRIEEEVGYSYEEWLEMKYGENNDEDDDEFFRNEELKERKKFIDQGIRIENDFYKSLERKKPYNGSGDNLSGNKKTYTILLPIEYFSEEKYLDHDEIKYSYKDFPNRTSFVRLIFSHVTNSDGEIVTGIQIPGSSKIYLISVLDESNYKIENKTKRFLESKYKEIGFKSIVYYIYKFAQLYHNYPEKDTIMYMKAYALNGSFYEEKLPDSFYYEFGSNENYVKRHFA